MSSKSHIVKLKNEITNELIIDLKKIKFQNTYISDIKAKEKLENLLVWLSKTPKNLVFRVNTILCQPKVAQDAIEKALQKFSRSIPSISTFSKIPETIVIHSWINSSELDLTEQSNEIIVDYTCGAAILRGANIYAPGVLGMPKGLKVGDKVSVYADLEQSCKKGLVKQYCSEKLFIGNGIVKLTREQIFNSSAENISGIAVMMTDVISHIPQLNENLLPQGHILLQNLPSIICSRILDPKADEIILDMCAAPGNKTSHISALMQNRGTVIALEKIKSKVERMIFNLKDFSVENVKAFCFDSTKAVSDLKNISVTDGPPFSAETFDRILLDGPCSALGQRPQICNNISLSQLRSYVPLQRKLFSVAVQLLKSGGILVYSTCTVTIAENEGIVAWALKTFPNLELQSLSKKLTDLKMEQFSTVGYNIDGLTYEQSNSLCRFESGSDSVGFFIAYFLKR